MSKWKQAIFVQVEAAKWLSLLGQGTKSQGQVINNVGSKFL